MSKTIEELIISDHLELKVYMNQYLIAKTKDDASKWYNQFVWELVRHHIGEEIVFFPLIKEMVPNGQQLVDSSLHDHRRIKESLIEINSTNPESLQYDSKIQQLWKDLQLHMETEENEEIAILSQYVSKEKRIIAGEKFESRKKISPTRPHNIIPDESPIIETILGLLIAPIDKFIDLFHTFPSKKCLEEVEKNTSHII